MTYNSFHSTVVIPLQCILIYSSTTTSIYILHYCIQFHFTSHFPTDSFHAIVLSHCHIPAPNTSHFSTQPFHAIVLSLRHIPPPNHSFPPLIVFPPL